MNRPSTSPAAQKLQRFVAFLGEDPTNPALLAEVCELALACGDHARAQACIDAAGKLALDPAQWSFRRAQLAIAQRELDTADRLLSQLSMQLAESDGARPVVAHDLAYVHLLRGEFERACDTLRPWLEPDRVAGLALPHLGALQVLWLRALHRLQRIDEGMAWARVQHQGGLLQAAAQGVASLIAIDAHELDDAERWADTALQADPHQLEALVARGSLSLARGDAQQATALLERALHSNPDDGRTWSALGFASLRTMDLAQAQARLERAVATMPDHADTWRALGWTRILRGDREGALAAFRRAAAIDPEHAETVGAMGLVQVLGGDPRQAAQLADAAEKLDADSVTVSLVRALLSGKANDPKALQALALRLTELGAKR